MTDKQIIIDGVDVSGCKYYDDETCCNEDVFTLDCENTNCMYKQLKRKEQEYEELRKYHNKCCEEFENEKQKLIDKYNQFSKDFFIGKYCKKEYCELLKAKEQECEELKNKIEFMEGYIKTVEKARDELERENKSSKEQAEQKLGRIRVIAFHNCDITDKNDSCYKILQIIDEVE